MTGHILWYFNNPFAGAGVQRDIGPFNPGTVQSIFKAQIHGEITYQSFNTGNPYSTFNDLVWGLQWVPHGSGPQTVGTSSVGDQWLWRHNVTLKTDVTRAFTTSGATGVVQGSDSLWESYSGQGNKPAQNIDIYVSILALFGIVVTNFSMIGSIDFYYS